MAVAGKTCCVGAGAGLSLGFVVLMIAAIVEKGRFEPFYQDAECPESPLAILLPLFSLPAAMGGQNIPPFGLFGSVLNRTQTCRNPNQVKLTTKKEDFSGTLYLPDLSKWAWGTSEKQLSSGKVNGSYIAVSSFSLNDDYVLPADGIGSVSSSAFANTSLTPFLSLFGAVHLTGYAPLYTKILAKVESCVKVFGIELCEQQDTVTWCGVLGGNCQAQMDIMPGVKVWVPALCALTKSICRLGGEKGEAEMKALVNAQSLGVTTVDAPCGPLTGMPANMNCPIATAPGINASMHQVSIPGFVDGPRPDSKDLEDAENMIILVTSLLIALGAIGSACSGSVTAYVAYSRKNPAVKAPTSEADAAKDASPESAAVPPVLLSSQAEAPKKQEQDESHV